MKLTKTVKCATALLVVAALAGGIALAVAPVPAVPVQIARIPLAPSGEHTKLPMPGGDPLAALLESATVLAPHTYENLTLFPVTASVVADFGPVLTMDEALDRGLLVVEEIGHGSVNQVTAINRSDRHIFMMASEMIGGAKQDRTLGEDVLLPPHGKITLPVYCVEQARWTPGAPEARFRSMEQSAPLGVRKTVRLQQSQSDVWRQVEREQERLAAPSATGALRSVYESSGVQHRLQPYVSKLGGVPSAAPNVIGVVVASGDRIICADLFCRPDLFRRLWPKLVRSYAAEAIGEYRERERVSLRDAERFLGSLYHADRHRLPTPGVGYALRLSGAAVNGSALVFKRSVVHLEVFPGVELLREPPRPEPRMDLRFRRERLEQSGR